MKISKGQIRIAMRRIGFTVFVLLLFASLTNAQVPTSGNVFVGYSYSNAGPLVDSTSRANLNGWEGSLEGKIFPWVGLVADLSGHYGSQDVPCSAAVVCDVSVHEENVLFGPRVSMSVGKIRPFAEALFGAGHMNTDGVGSDTSFATALGGGIDYKIIRPVAWRFQGDYVQTRFFGTTQNNVRLSTGIVFRF
jgi:hypothetical protein